MISQPKTPGSWPTVRCYRLALIMVILGGITWLPEYVYIPFHASVKVSGLVKAADGILSEDFSVSWPLKINKTYLARIEVELPDGTKLDRMSSHAALTTEAEAQGFFVDQPDIYFRVPENLSAQGNAELKVTLPVKLRDLFFKGFFGIAAALLAFAKLGPGLATILQADHRRSLAFGSASLAGSVAGFLLLPEADGIAVWLALLLVAAGIFVPLALLLHVGEKQTGRPSSAREPLIGTALLICTVLASLALFEGYLGFIAEPRKTTELDLYTGQDEWYQLPRDVVHKAKARALVASLTLPDAWQRQEKEVQGATRAFLWHGVLHVEDISGFRRLNGPFPAKPPSTFRVLVVGDSLTYGVGIDAQWTFSSLLEAALKPDYGVEVVNLGRNGYQSEDILGVLYEFLPQIDPDLVIYAVCLNDFLPSAQRQYAAYPFPLPKEWKKFFLQRTHLARLFDDAYQSLLLAIGLKSDFFDDILAGKKTYQTRFAHDVAAMNRLVEETGLPPMIGFVFHQSLDDLRGWALVEIAEQALEDGGFDLISVKAWRERYKGRNFRVSPWEGHPNELANSVVAEMLYNRVRKGGYLKGYERD
jgi:hypothetical protein